MRAIQGEIEIDSASGSTEDGAKNVLLKGLNHWLKEHSYQPSEMDFYYITINKEKAQAIESPRVVCNVQIFFSKHIWSGLGVGAEASNAFTNCLTKLSPTFIECI